MTTINKHGMKKFEVTFDVIDKSDIDRFVLPSFWFFIWAVNEEHARMKVWEMGFQTYEEYHMSTPFIEEVTE